MSKPGDFTEIDAAIVWLRDRLGECNEGQSTCECCGLVRYADWNEHKKAESIRAALERLAKVKDQITTHQQEAANERNKRPTDRASR